MHKLHEYLEGYTCGGGGGGGAQTLYFREGGREGLGESDHSPGFIHSITALTTSLQHTNATLAIFAHLLHFPSLCHLIANTQRRDKKSIGTLPEGKISL